MDMYLVMHKWNIFWLFIHFYLGGLIFIKLKLEVLSYFLFIHQHPPSESIKPYSFQPTHSNCQMKHIKILTGGLIFDTTYVKYTEAVALGMGLRRVGMLHRTR